MCQACAPVHCRYCCQVPARQVPGWPQGLGPACTSQWQGLSPQSTTPELALQELYRWPATTKAGKRALGLRYRLLPHLYTAFQAASRRGLPVARHLWMEHPGDPDAHAVDAQWFLGDGILVTPVLQQVGRLLCDPYAEVMSVQLAPVQQVGSKLAAQRPCLAGGSPCKVNCIGSTALLPPMLLGFAADCAGCTAAFLRVASLCWLFRRQHDCRPPQILCEAVLSPSRTAECHNQAGRLPAAPDSAGRRLCGGLLPFWQVVQPF